eukprot:1876960-Pyramimonas_sp.AAC.1
MRRGAKIARPPSDHLRRRIFSGPTSSETQQYPLSTQLSSASHSGPSCAATTRGRRQGATGGATCCKPAAATRS